MRWSSRRVRARRRCARLQKPPVAAWAINQLFWQQREVYDRLTGSAGDLRAAHAAVLAGKPGDVRSAGKSHEESIEVALKATLALLRDAGQPATDATRQAVATTLRALPGAEAPGQLTTTLQPGGFEMLAGLPVSGKAARPVPAARAVLPTPETDRSRHKPDAAALRRAKEAAADAEREARLAEHAAQREGFEAARAGREAEKAQKAVVSARAAVKEAEEALAEAERAAGRAAEAKEAAEERASAATDALEAARERAKALRADR